MAKRTYFRDILSFFGSNITSTLCNIVIGVLLSRMLGAAGFGLYSFIIVVPIIVIGFTQMGIRRSTIYHIGKKMYSENSILSALLLIMFGTSGLSIIICGFVYFLSESKPFDPLIIVLVLVTIPFLLSNIFAGGFLLGKEMIYEASILNVAPTMLTLVFTVVFVGILKMSVLGAFLSIAIANLITFFFTFRTIIVKFKYDITWKYHEGIIKSMIKLGLVNAIAVFIMQLNYRLDVLMLKKLSTLEEVGFYSLAMQIAEQLLQIPIAIESIILSRSANTQDNRLIDRDVASIFRISLLTGLLGGVIIFLVAPSLVPLIFGKEFIHSIIMIQVVLPGILILIGFRILNSRLTGMGKPQIAIYTFLPALIINFVLNLFLIPKYGGLGAAWSTNVSYAIGSVAFMLVYSRQVGMPMTEIVKFKKSDFNFIRDFRKNFSQKRKSG